MSVRVTLHQNTIPEHYTRCRREQMDSRCYICSFPHLLLCNAGFLLQPPKQLDDWADCGLNLGVDLEHIAFGIGEVDGAVAARLVGRRFQDGHPLGD